jgi:hypothetical protein
MTDAVTSQNIDLSYWDTLYNNMVVNCKKIKNWKERHHDRFEDHLEFDGEM